MLRNIIEDEKMRRLIFEHIFTRFFIKCNFFFNVKKKD